MARAKFLLTRIIAALFVDREGYISRKLAAAWCLTILVTCLLMFHVFFSLFIHKEVIQIFPADNYTTVLMAIWGTYFASDATSNVAHAISRRVQATIEPDTDKPSDRNSNGDES